MANNKPPLIDRFKAVGSAFKSLFVNEPLVPASYRGMSNASWYFSPDGLNDVHFSFTGTMSIREAYSKCPPLTAIINKKVQAYVNGDISITDSKGNEAKGPNVEKLKALMRRPNPIQTWPEFEAQMYAYTQLFGWCLLLPVVPYGFDNIDAKHIWVISPHRLEIEEKTDIDLSKFNDKKLNLIKSVKLNIGNFQVPLNPDQVFIVRDSVLNFNSSLLPGSRIQSLEFPINNIIGAYESRNVLINFRGALGILSHDPGKSQYAAMAITSTQKEELQKDFSRYGLKRSQWQVILTDASLKWQQMGYPTKDLMLFEEIEDDIMRICDQYNFPSPLINSAQGPSVSNTKEFKQQVYQDAIIPEAKSLYQQLSEFFQLDQFGLVLTKDYSKLTVLQNNKKEEAESRKTLNEALKFEWDAGLITLNQWLLKLGEPAIGPIGDIRSTDPKPSNVPLAVIIGVGGVQSLIQVLTAQGMSNESRQAALEIIFGLTPENAARMAAGNNNQSSQDGNQQQQQQQQQ
ncbi:MULTISPECIES: phage portal protein [unclassified Paraflavitalea]|uniref:phage portal protein n=1 Tax=unclassified Paraflavitalea TaxID=2798305 RepID=UPI003D34B003